MILDTEHLFAEINDTVLRRFGRKLTPELNEGRMGRKLVEAVEYLLKQTGLDSKVTADVSYYWEGRAGTTCAFRNT